MLEDNFRQASVTNHPAVMTCQWLPPHLEQVLLMQHIEQNPSLAQQPVMNILFCTSIWNKHCIYIFIDKAHLKIHQVCPLSLH